MKKLTSNQEPIALGMLYRGDNQHDVAAHFGTNSARINELWQNRNKGEQVPAGELPPSGSFGLKLQKIMPMIHEAMEKQDVDGIKNVLRVCCEVYEEPSEKERIAKILNGITPPGFHIFDGAIK